MSCNRLSILALAALTTLSACSWAPRRASAQEAEQVDLAATAISPRQALAEGNGHFASGELDLALERYRTGYRPESVHPTLIYNLATTLHHLDRLPEAILWYRRGDPQDPWLEENLWLARRSLGSQRLPLEGPMAWLVDHRSSLVVAAMVIAWLSLFIAVFAARKARAAWATASSLALLLYAITLATELRGPREAVLMTDCSSAKGELPAGTELWIWPSKEGSQEVAGVPGMSCPRDSLEWIRP